jgi:hypothetical protein
LVSSACDWFSFHLSAILWWTCSLEAKQMGPLNVGLWASFQHCEITYLLFKNKAPNFRYCVIGTKQTNSET